MRKVDRKTFQRNIWNRSTDHTDFNNLEKKEVRLHFDAKGNITGAIVYPDHFFLPERIYNEL